MSIVNSNLLLLSHPFYRRWECGKLADGELARYAEQYRHFEQKLPEFLKSLSAMMDAPGEAEARAFVDANLRDELGSSTSLSHAELFEQFAAAVKAGGPSVAATPATQRLLDVYQDAIISKDKAVALGVLAGYEVQAAEVAKTKGESLSKHYGLNANGTEFWDVHSDLEKEHADWTMSAAKGVDSEGFAEGVRRSSVAWYQFMDEREAMATF